MRTTATGTILTRTAVPRANLYLAVMFTAGSDEMRVVAASALACQAQAEIVAAFQPWGQLIWPADPAEYLNNEDSPVDEPLPVDPPPDNQPDTWEPP